jgi:hypothetical protein
VSELISNSSIDAFPGESKLYFTAGDLEDLDWAALESLPPLEPDVQEKANEIVRDRDSDLCVQAPPAKRARLDNNIEDTGTKRPQRVRKRNVRLKDFLCGYVCITNLSFRSNNLICTRH